MTNWSFFWHGSMEVPHILIEAYAEPCHKLNSPGQHSIQTSASHRSVPKGCLNISLSLLENKCRRKVQYLV